jgi:shikimate 5-dehydrogenase
MGPRGIAQGLTGQSVTLKGSYVGGTEEVLDEGERRPSIAWIGTGVMGAAMCAHLLEAGHPVTFFSRTKEKALSLLGSGAQWSGSLPRQGRVWMS